MARQPRRAVAAQRAWLRDALVTVMTPQTPWWWKALAPPALQASNVAASMATKICAGARAVSREGSLARNAVTAALARDGSGGAHCGCGGAASSGAGGDETASTASSSKSYARTGTTRPPDTVRLSLVDMARDARRRAGAPLPGTALG